MQIDYCAGAPQTGWAVARTQLAPATRQSKVQYSTRLEIYVSVYANLLLVCCFAPGTRQSKVQYSSRLQNICFVRYLVREIYVFRNICFYMPTFMLHEMLSTSANNKTQFPFYQFIKRTKVIMYTVISITSLSLERVVGVSTDLFRNDHVTLHTNYWPNDSLPLVITQCFKIFNGHAQKAFSDVVEGCHRLVSVEYAGSTLL